MTVKSVRLIFNLMHGIVKDGRNAMTSMTMCYRSRALHMARQVDNAASEGRMAMAVSGGPIIAKPISQTITIDLLHHG
jgi:hypothetical protein